MLLADQMVMPLWLAVAAWCLIPFSVFEMSNLLAVLFQSGILMCYAIACIKMWREPVRFPRLRRWLPIGYPVVVLVSNLILLAGALVSDHFRTS